MTEVEINKSIKLSEHMKLGELTVTSVKTADGRSAQGDALLAKNIPSHVAIENLKRLCKWLEHLRRGLALGSRPDEKVAKRLYVSTRPQCEAFAAGVERKARRLTAGEDKGIVMGLIGWDGVLG